MPPWTSTHVASTRSLGVPAGSRRPSSKPSRCSRRRYAAGCRTRTACTATSSDGAQRGCSTVPKTENFQWYVEQVAPGEIHGHALSKTLVSGQTPFQAYAIVVSALFGKMLVLDGDTQSAQLDEAIYHEALVHPACALFGEPRRALILGGAEGASLRELLRVPTMQRATMVDIDGDVVAACREHLPEWSAGAFEDPRAELIVGDAKAYVESSTEQFDVIV